RYTQQQRQHGQTRNLLSKWHWYRPGLPLTGDDRRNATGHLLGWGLPIEASTRHAYVSGDLALLIVDWSIRGTAADGTRVDLSGAATDVLRRGGDGRWRYAIDNPFGTAAG
ncbi:YybH family protein, partial [Amycolatopsis magusensis]|uniref:YybH family protein n=1 Tax=Amycolatopsis magusensis TaxID=882444 RepID=UPI003F68376D|nr:hypothetical protein [Amycolatopsis magusensis]